MPKLKQMKFRGWTTLVNRDVGVAPYFTSLLRKRIKKKQATNVVTTGEAGNSKSYLSFDICRVLEGLTPSGKDRFTLRQVVFTFRGFLKAMLELPMGRPIVFDEPSYAMGKRDWYKELNKALVLTVESVRFKVHPLFIPIINKALLDKTIRSYLLQFQVETRDRGKATVYRIHPSQHTEKIYRYTLCRLEFALFDRHLCKKDSCLDCKKLMTCRIFRAKYERKKASIQESRYGTALEMASKRESLELTDQQIENLLYSMKHKIINKKGKLDVNLISIVAEEDFGVVIGHNRRYKMKKRLEFHHPDEFK